MTALALPLMTRPGRPSASVSPTLRARNLRWLLATMAGSTARQIAADPRLSEGHGLRTIQTGLRHARALAARLDLGNGRS